MPTHVAPVEDGGLDELTERSRGRFSAERRRVRRGPYDQERDDRSAARVGPGATVAEFDHEAQAFGLTTRWATTRRRASPGSRWAASAGSRVSMDDRRELRSVDVITAGGQLHHAADGVHVNFVPEEVDEERAAYRENYSVPCSTRITPVSRFPSG